MPDSFPFSQECLLRFGTVLAVVVVGLGIGVSASTADAAVYPAGSVGHDVSYPPGTG